MAVPAVSNELLILGLLPGLLQCPFKNNRKVTPQRAQKKSFSFLKTAALHQRSKLSLVYVIGS